MTDLTPSQTLCLRIRYQSLRREHALREVLRSSNHVAAIGRVAVGKAKPGTKQAPVPTQTQADFTEMGAAFSPIFAAAIGVWEVERKAAEKELRALAQALPVWPWVESNVRGLGPLGLGLIVGAAVHHTGAGLERFPNPSAFWKRMGLAVIDGRRQQRIAGTTPERIQLALAHGYSPSRRSLMFVVSDAILKQNKGEYRALYDARKALELAKIDEDVASRKMLAHRRALRYMVKRLLRHLWCAWQGSRSNERPARRSQPRESAAGSANHGG